jgi:predicted alpha/beta superfamily hydrolase
VTRRMTIRTTMTAAVLALAATRAAAQETAPPYDSLTLQSAEVQEARRINVYLPPGYAEARGTRYPVLYMPDGGIQEDFPHVAAAVDSAIRAGEMRPMLVVGIENTQRRRDMTGPTTVARDSTIAPRVGGSAAFRAFIARELMPEIERRYRVTNQTAIMGESLAGLFVVETFFAQPDLFDTYIALSPSLWWNAEALVRASGERLRTMPRVRAALFVASASDDVAAEAGRLADALREHAPASVRWRYEPRPDLTHATIYRGMEAKVLRDWFPAHQDHPDL